jgi:hypothetical protein
MTFEPLQYAVALCAATSVLCAVSGIALLRRGPRRVVRLGAGVFTLLLALVLLAGGALCAAVAAGLSGYRALVREDLAATVYTTPTGPQSFDARFVFPDRSEASFILAGDEFSVEARILKWHPWINLLGIHTAYELDRVSGRYSNIEDERRLPRTVYPLGSEQRVVDLFAWRARLPWLAPLVDAEYGSGTFIRPERDARFEVRVSTTGLLVRRVP